LKKWTLDIHDKMEWLIGEFYRVKDEVLTAIEMRLELIVIAYFKIYGMLLQECLYC
jgi:hypothetical protein